MSMLNKVRQRHYDNNGITEHDLAQGVVYACLDLSKEWAEIAIEENPDEQEPMVLLGWVMKHCRGAENPKAVHEHLIRLLTR
jgi:hypothetical protein